VASIDTRRIQFQGDGPGYVFTSRLELVPVALGFGPEEQACTSRADVLAPRDSGE
jgi:hypothetical protein